VRSLSDRYDSAVAGIDAANAADPNSVVVRGRSVALALAHGSMAVEWIEQLVDDPDEALLLAARAHHLRRWEVQRDTYPQGRAGYLRWRRDQKDRHARDVAALLAAAGYDAVTVERVQQLIRRQPVDGAQAVEDAACLVFIETQLAAMARRIDEDRMIEVIRKTAGKMSADALRLVSTIPLAEMERMLLVRALSAPA
jgi:hypothetical protein